MLAADLIAATRRHLYGTQRDPLNKLDGAVLLGDTTVTVLNVLGPITEGAVISVGLEDMYVWSADVDSRTVTVERGFNGSVQSAHDDGAVVEVNPRYSQFSLLSHVNTDLADLCAPTNGLYQIRTLDVTAVSGQVGYDFAVEGFLSIADVRWREIGPVTHRWFDLDGWSVEDSMPLDQFPSGTALFLGGGLPTPGTTIRVRYRAAFSPLTSLSDDVAETTGLPETALDLPSLGAAILAGAGRPIGRSQFSSQGDTRRADEVSVGDTLNAPAALRQARAARIKAEAARLSQQWPQTADRIVL